MSCHFCYNAYVWAKEHHDEEDYFDEGLHDDNDAGSSTIGSCASKHQIFFNSGNGEPCNIEICEWKENGYRGKPGWTTVGIYYPKFCPECGRELSEYKIGERGANYESKRND